MNMNNRIKEILKYTISLAVAALLLYFSFRGVEWREFLDALTSCRWEFIVLSMAVSVLAFWLRGLRWRGIILPIDPGMSRVTTFNAVNIGYIANFVFPRIGEFVRCGVISRRSKSATYDKVLGTVVLERGWDLLSMFIFLAALLISRWERFGTFFVTKMWEPLSERLSFSLWWIVAILVLLSGLCIWGIYACRKRSGSAAKIWSLAQGLANGFTSAFRMEHKWRFFAYTLAVWLCYWAMAVLTMWAIPDLDALNVVDALFLMIAGSLGWLVPVPGGFGAFHFIVSLALSTIYGIPFELGIVFATLSHESQSVTMLLAGAGSWFYETLKKDPEEKKA